MDKSVLSTSPAEATQLLRRSRIREGKPFPLGATWDGLGVNFALFSAHATKVELCLFDDTGATELERIELPEYTDEGVARLFAERPARSRLRLQGSWSL